MCAAQLLQRFGWGACASVDIFMRAQLAGERLFVLAAADGYRAKAHLAGILNAEMAEAADALDSNQVAAAGSNIAQCVEYGDSGTEQRSGFVSGKIVGHRGDRLGADHHVLGVAPIEVDGGNFFVLAQNEIPPAAGVALKAVSAMPSHTDSLPWLPQRYVGANRVDASGDLVAGDARILKSRPDPFFDQRVAVADAAGLDLNSHLAAARMGDRTLDEFEISAWLADLDCSHNMFSHRLGAAKCL